MKQHSGNRRVKGVEAMWAENRRTHISRRKAAFTTGFNRLERIALDPRRKKQNTQVEVVTLEG